MERGTSYFGVRDVDHAVEDLDRFREAGLDAVLHTFSERDRRYYRGTVADIVDASADRGFTVYVGSWALGRVFGGEALSEFVGRHPEARQRLSTGDRVPAACLNHPTFRAFVRDWARDAAGLGADVVFWDEPHWFIPEWFEGEVEVPDGAWACRCEHCRDRFAAEHGGPMPETETAAVAAFKEASLVDFLEDAMATVADAGAGNAVCLLPGEDAAVGLTDWTAIAESDHLDVLATDPYWDAHGREVEGFVGRYTRKVVDLAAANDLRSQIWIQGFRLDAGEVGNVRTATRVAMDGGVDSVFMWGWDGCRSISSIACADPMGVWNAYLETLGSRSA